MRFAGYAAIFGRPDRGGETRMKVVLSCGCPSTTLRVVPLPTKQSSAGRTR
jgi:hypothetical protein